MKKIISLLISAAMLTAILPYSMVSAASSFTTSNGSVIIEAEGANWTEAKFTNTYKGFEKKSDSNANGGYYLRPHSYSGTTDPSSVLSFTVTANERGRYTLWVRASSSSDDGSAFWIKYNNRSWYRDELSPADSGSYTWIRLVSNYLMNANDTVTFNFAPKNTDSHIDCFVFTDKASFVPSGKVSSVSAQTFTTDTYGAPKYTPILSHPRVMFNSDTLETIRANYSKSQNDRAVSNFVGYRDADTNGTLTVTNSVTSNFDIEIEYQIEADAFEYALNGTVANGNSAVTQLINYLRTVTFDPEEQDVTRNIGSVIFHAAEVYDWCYDLLTTSQKNEIISLCEGLASGIEQGYPPSDGGNVSGHSGEPNILRDLLAFGIAVYNERPDIYNYVMGRIQNYMVPARDDFYKSHSVYQGTSYGYYRLYFELCAYQLTLAATGHKLFSDDIGQVIYSYIYDRRPDGRLFSYGDDASIEWVGYNDYALRAVKMAADIFDNKDFKQEYYLMRSTRDYFSGSRFTNYQSFNAVLSLIMNKPDTGYNYTSEDHSNLPLSRYFGSPNGMILARTSWAVDKDKTHHAYYNRTDSSTWNLDMSNTDTAAVLMKVGERYGGNHDHLDAGSFQLYYKGLLAGDSGTYTKDGYSTEHNTNYAKRTVAHNALTIYDSSESFSILGTGTSNDGGQLFYNEASNLAIWKTYKRATVLDHENNDNFSYIKGDITAAYKSSKASKVLRSMAFIPTDDTNFKAMLVVYDEVTSKNSSQTKKFLLHTMMEPSVSGNTVTVENTKTIQYGTDGKDGTIHNAGRLTMKTLLPKSATITKIGGSGSEYKVNGTNYPPEDTVYDLNEAGWGRVEVQASSEGTSTKFLNVLAVSDAGNTTTLPATLIEGNGFVGVEALNKVVIFAEGSNRLGSAISYTPSGSGSVDVTVFGAEAGDWVAMQSGIDNIPAKSTVDGGTLAFTVNAGTKFTVQQGSMYEYTDPVVEAYDSSTAMAELPEDAVEAINGGDFTLVFTPTVINKTNDKKSLALFGDVKSEFAIYRLADASDIYVKLPGTKSILGRAGLSESDVWGHTSTITFSSSTRQLRWYIDGELQTSKVYPEGSFSLESIPFLPGGGTVEFSRIRVWNITLTSDEVEQELVDFQ